MTTKTKNDSRVIALKDGWVIQAEVQGDGSLKIIVTGNGYVWYDAYEDYGAVVIDLGASRSYDET